MARLSLWPVAAGVAALAVLAAAFGSSGYAASLICWTAINVLIAASLRFVLQIGELNFATAAFVGLGAYSAGVASTMLNLPFAVVLVVGPLVAGLVSLAFGWITLRTKGPYFLLIGFAFTEVVRMIYSQSNWLGGNSGMVGIYPPVALEPYFPAFTVVLVAIVLAGLHAIERSDFGRILVAIRQNDGVVQTVGIDVHLVKVACFAIASVAAGLGGVLQAHVNNVISPGDFGFLLSTFALAYVKVGGESHFAGPIVGAVVMTLLGTFALGLGTGEHVFYGAAIVLAVLALPNGIVGLVQNVAARMAPRRPAPVITPARRQEVGG